MLEFGNHVNVGFHSACSIRNLGFLFGCLQGNGPNQGPSEYPSQVSGAAVALRSFGEFVLLVGLINSSR